MKWTQREYKNRDGSYRIVNPSESGYYYVTDGYNVQLAHFLIENSIGTEWGIYGYDDMGIIKHCYSLDDMNFNIVGYCKPEHPRIPRNYQNY